MEYTFLIDLPITSIPKGTLVRLCNGDFKFKRWYAPEPNTFEAFHDWIFVEFEGIDKPIIQHRTYHPIFATIMDNVSPYTRDNSGLQVEMKMQCVMTFEAESKYDLPLCCRDFYGRLKEPLSIK